MAEPTDAEPSHLTILYGGTFDPVHLGHLAVARHARDTLGASVRLMPAADPPHRAAPGASALHRARMLDLAVAGKRGLEVDRREMQRNTPSYTSETLRELRRELGPDQPVALLVGADSFRGLPEWKDWEVLPTLAHFVVAARPGIELSDLPEALSRILDQRRTDRVSDLQASPAGRMLFLRQPLQPESATRVRSLIASGGPWQHLVPASVAGYIDRHRLYASTDATSPSL